MNPHPVYGHDQIQVDTVDVHNNPNAPVRVSLDEIKWPKGPGEK